MTEESKEEGGVIGEPDGIGTPRSRKVRPVLAFLANFIGLGLGYLYVGEIRLALASVIGTLGVLAFFAWTRLIVSSAAALWIGAAIILLVTGITLIHPVVIAIRYRQRALTRYNRWWVYLVWIALIGVFPYYLVSHRAQLFGYEPFRTPTAAMSPTLAQGDFFMTNTWRYRINSPAVGEIVVFERPEVPGVNYVKRVVGVPGDRVEARDGVLYRNGQAVMEPYLHPLVFASAHGRSFEPRLVGPSEVFVLGDYRDNSLDSREWGPIPIDHLQGRAQYIWFSMADGAVRWNRVGISLRP
jgi:signal peptidase I